MRAKRILIGATAGIAGLIGCGTALDFFCGTKYFVNYAYCTAMEITKDFDRNEVVEIPVAVYYDGFLQREDIDKCYKAYSMVEDEMLRQFGIKLNMIDSGARGLPECATAHYLNAIGSSEAEINLYCVSHVYQAERKCDLGLSDRIENTIQVVSTMNLDETSDVMIHEIGHMFYAEHSDNPFCVMFHHSICFRMDKWCDEEKAVITEYKHRFW
jgi:hypothetical protein